MFIVLLNIASLLISKEFEKNTILLVYLTMSLIDVDLMLVNVIYLQFYFPPKRIILLNFD